MKNNKVVLAFSGGLDTSYCAKYLSNDLNLEVHSAIINTGGFSEDELIEIESKALKLGVKSHVCLEKTAVYYEKIIRYLIFGNILKNNTYPLSVSAERIFQAIAIAEYAKEIGASAIAHGSTGAGNDQVRFDLIFQLVCPTIQIITPIRDLKLSRNEEIAYLKSYGVEFNWKKASYSINKGLWGTSIGGKETLTSHLELPEEAYPHSLENIDQEIIELTFEKGEIKAIDGVALSPIEAIQLIENRANSFAIGRDMHVGDTIIGIKGRIAFEAAAPLILIKAHHLLEKHTLTKWQLHWKEQLANWYGMFLHEAQYFEPVMRNIESFLSASQETVSGKVHVKLLPYRFELIGIESQHDLMNSTFGEYGEMNNAWSSDDVKGFTKISLNATLIHHTVNNLIS